MISDTPAVRLDHVSKQFGDVTAVDDVSLEIRQQEFLTILGPSGAGKSTLLHMIAGFDEPTSGHIAIDGEDVTTAPPYERNIGMVFQSMALFPHMTVGENVAFPLKMRRIDPAHIEDRVAEMLELIRLPDIADRNVQELSGGQRQRVAMARSLAFEPSILLLDEPLSSLDKKLREEMRRELLRIHRETDVTTVHVTHNQEEALVMADRVAVIQDGEVVQHATTQELYDRPTSAFVADFVGNTNLLAGRITALADATCRVELNGADTIVACPVDSQDADLAVGDPVDLAIRYERLRVGDDLATDTTFSGEIAEVTFEGDTITYEVDVSGGDLTLSVTELKTARRDLYQRGEAVQVGWNVDAATIYPASNAHHQTIDT
ncbi:ABC-type spermidine/putrescine transport system,ATPase component [Halanaeroarchaeum sp. HSR-CO]|uniref:ABC transporter ATP-binding protein n=1 Tax=Halanaeroarchaeum sp. HSR-CO TaxID=2866382 RepID=UPI00217EF98C|nr:ABC transporter ATP-binding protein [Halanaeroarchaeum sp. HSR-CO]UWG47526.1 ABC-type spermidine/putrescine transport system,ATPase component [Halanaeroarchaeum sp. HSR-CO]